MIDDYHKGSLRGLRSQEPAPGPEPDPPRAHPGAPVHYSASSPRSSASSIEPGELEPALISILFQQRPGQGHWLPLWLDHRLQVRPENGFTSGEAAEDAVVVSVEGGQEVRDLRLPAGEPHRQETKKLWLHSA